MHSFLFSLPNYKGLHRFNTYAYYLQAGFGTRYLEFNPYIMFRASIKMFYLLKSVPNNTLIFMPYLAFVIPVIKKKPDVVMNPRF